MMPSACTIRRVGDTITTSAGTRRRQLGHHVAHRRQLGSIVPRDRRWIRVSAAAGGSASTRPCPCRASPSRCRSGRHRPRRRPARIEGEAGHPPVAGRASFSLRPERSFSLPCRQARPPCRCASARRRQTGRPDERHVEHDGRRDTFVPAWADAPEQHDGRRQRSAAGRSRHCRPAGGVPSRRRPARCAPPREGPQQGAEDEIEGAPIDQAISTWCATLPASTLRSPTCPRRTAPPATAPPAPGHRARRRGGRRATATCPHGGRRRQAPAFKRKRRPARRPGPPRRCRPAAWSS